jgi:hypothetical protein
VSAGYSQDGPVIVLEHLVNVIEIVAKLMSIFHIAVKQN